MNMSLNSLHSLMEAEAKAKRIPLSGDFEITPRCNLNCVMCYVRRHPTDNLAIENEMSAEKIISIAKQARDMGMMYILLTGGEILVRKDFKYIYEEIKNLGLIVTLYTNGTLITQEWVDWIAKNPPFKISITLYGASADTYEKVTGNRNGYNLVLRAIDMLIEKGIKVELKTTWIKSSVNEYYQLLNFSEIRGLKLFVVNYIFPTEENIITDPLGNRLDSEELARKESEIEEYAKRYSNEQVNNVVTFESDETNQRATHFQEDAFHCNAGATSFWLTWRGEIQPCGTMTATKVAIENDDFNNAWVKINELRTKIPICDTCRQCDAREQCMSCPARLFIETGSYTKPAEYLCKNAKMHMKIKRDKMDTQIHL